MARHGTLMDMVQHSVATGMAKASIQTAETKLKDGQTANQALSQRWHQMLNSPQAAADKANNNVGDWEQTQLIIDVQNLVPGLAKVVIAQQAVITAMLGALKNLNQK